MNVPHRDTQMIRKRCYRCPRVCDGLARAWRVQELLSEGSEQRSLISESKIECVKREREHVV